MTIDEYVLSFMIGIVCAGFGFYMGMQYGGQTEYVEVPVYINQTIVKEVPCTHSCLDARNEGYLDGTAECDLHNAYITALDGRIRSLDNLEAFWNTRGIICVKTQGRTTDEVLSAFIHEMIHRDIYEFDDEHFCGVTK